MKATLLAVALLVACVIGCTERKEPSKADTDTTQPEIRKSSQRSNQTPKDDSKTRPDSATNSIPVELLELAELKANAEKEDAEAQSELGNDYFYGIGVERNLEEAVKWLQKAADQGRTSAMTTLAGIYEDEDSQLHNLEKSFQLIFRAVQAGDKNSQVWLGQKYIEGRGTPTNVIDGLRWYKQGLEAKEEKAKQEEAHTNKVRFLREWLANDLIRLGDYYSEGKFLSKDVTNAIRWYEQAAAQNDSYFSKVAWSKLSRIHFFETKNFAEETKWLRRAAEAGDALSQYNLGVYYEEGKGVIKDDAQAVKWYRSAADQDFSPAEANLGVCYHNGQGLPRDYVEAVKWWRKAAEQGDPAGQHNLGACYSNGEGVPKDYVEAYKWMNLAFAQDYELSKNHLPTLEQHMTRDQIAEAQRLSREFKPRKALERGATASRRDIFASQPAASGTGFFITDDGYLISNAHVVEGATQIRLVTNVGLISAKLVKVDAANDLALLKAEGRFASLPIATSRGVKLGGTVATVGFPNVGLQGFAPKLAKGEIAALSGAQDDARYFQISVPVQPGNSGGALVDERGNVVGIVSAKLNASAALQSSGALPENVNYAVKSSYLLSFLESVPDVASKLKEAQTKEKKFEDVVKDAEQAAVLVLVY